VRCRRGRGASGTRPEACFSRDGVRASSARANLRNEINCEHYAAVTRQACSNTCKEPTCERIFGRWGIRPHQPVSLQSKSQLLRVYYTLLKRSTWSTLHALVFSSVLVESRHSFLLAGIALQDVLLLPSLSPIFLLAQILWTVRQPCSSPTW